MRVDQGDVRQTRSHWWWRPGWGPGSRYATFHLTFERAPELTREAARVGPYLTELPNVDVVPPRWLHLTMTGVGFIGDHSSSSLLELAEEVSTGAASLEPTPLDFDALYLGREGLSLAARPAPWLTALKGLQEAAIRRRWGIEHPERPFHPHVSLAYFRGPVDLELLRRTIERASLRDLVVAGPMLSLIELGRDAEVYTWRVLAQSALGADSPRMTG